MILKVIALLVSCLLLQVAEASQEGVLSFSEFQIKSNGIGESGIIIVNGKKDNNGNFTSLSVGAFGKTIDIPHIIMEQIPSQNQNGIQLSYEAGYRVLEGKMIYLQFQDGFISGVRETFIISVSESGNIEIIK